MSIIITNTPKRKLIEGFTPANNTPQSNWVALNNPIIYEAIRRDYTINTASSINDGSGNYVYKIELTTSLSGSDTISVDDYIYLKAGNVLDKVVKVTNVLTPKIFTVDEAFNGNASGGICNLITKRENYHALVELLGVENDQYYVIAQFTARHNNKGIFSIQVDEFLKKISGFENISNYDTFQIKDDLLSNTFNIRFVERWRNNTTEITGTGVIDNYRTYFVNTVQQLLSPFGQNLGEYVPMKEGETKALFLGAFERPTIFLGYPMDISFIFSDNIHDQAIFYSRTEYDINGNQTVQTVGQLENDKSLFVNRLLIDPSDYTAKTLEFYLFRDTTANPLGGVTTYAVEHTDNYWEEVPMIAPPQNNI